MGTAHSVARGRDKGSLRLSFLQLKSIMRDLIEQYLSIELRSGLWLEARRAHVRVMWTRICFHLARYLDSQNIAEIQR